MLSKVGGISTWAAFHSQTEIAMKNTHDNTIAEVSSDNRSDHPSSSITSILAKASLIATLIGMLVYSAFEYLLGETPTLSEFAGHHLLPAVLIGVTVCVTLSIILHAKIISPVMQIFKHLYRIGSGQLSPLSLDSRVSEIRTVVDGVNLLVTRLKGDPKNGSLGKALDDLVKLRGDLEEVTAASNRSADTFVPVMQDLRRLEGDLLAVMQSGNYSS